MAVSFSIVCNKAELQAIDADGAGGSWRNIRVSALPPIPVISMLRS